MAIDRTNWTALVDDDGSNTVGTLWTKDKVKTVLLDPIDAAIIAPGGQLAFPATQIPSANANTLDDYEEGTWTPSIGGTATYTSQFGRYTKIGNKVTCIGTLTINAIGTGSTSVISGLPFTVLAGSLPPVTIGYFGAIATSVVMLSGYANGGASTIQLTCLTAAGATMSFATAIFKNSADVWFGVTYLT
jgi:hypothetical protein